MKYIAIMSDKQMDRLDVLTKKMVKEIPQEKPSINFSKNVMDTVFAIELAKELKKSKPLIAKKTWFLLGMIIVAATIFLYMNATSNTSLLATIDISTYTNAIYFDMPMGFSVSNATIYGFVFFALMIGIQIKYIKNYHSRNWQ